MGVTQFIYEERDLTRLSDEMLKNIDKAVLAAAFTIRDAARQAFITQSSSIYKHHTGNISKLAAGLMIGKISDSKVKIHSLGSRDFYDSYKTRFFVGGTIPRTQTKRNGKNIKPYTKGYLRANEAIDIGMANANSILNNYINNVLQK